MRDKLSLLNPWGYVVGVLLFTPLAARLGSEWNWTAGAATLALAILPTTLAALSEQRSAAAATALVAALGCILERSFFVQQSLVGQDWLFPVLAAGVLLGLSGTIVGVVDLLEQRMHLMSRENADYLRNLYQTQRETTAPKANLEVAALQAASERENGGVNYPMLLLTLQDLGRRISSHLDFETLVPTIISSAKGVLHCGDCQVFLWDGRTRAFRQIPAGRQRQEAAFVPNPQRGLGAWMLENRQIITRGDVERDLALSAACEAERQLPDAAAPLTVGGEFLGMLVLSEVSEDSSTFARMLYILANFSALGIKNAQLFARIEDLARRDGLTGLLNHATFQEELLRQQDLAAARSQPLSLIMGDVDHFKKFNDTHGHQAGDHVLREVARVWQAVMPDHAVVARYGGEEFICALPGDDVSRAAELADTLRQTLADLPLSFAGQPLQVTSSFGVSVLAEGQTPEQAIARADEALYRAKQAGRNRVCSAAVRAAAIHASAVQDERAD